MPSKNHLALTAALFFAALASCEKPSPKEQPTSRDDGTRPGAVPSSPSEAPRGEPPSAAALAPLVREEAEEGVAPSGVAIELAMPIFENLTAASAKGDVLEIAPETPGQLTRRSRSTLIFTPRDGFLPGTEYTVRLRSVETKDGVVSFTSREAPERVFKTPPFSFVRVDVKSFDRKQNRVEAELVFSGAVDVPSVEKAGTFTVGGARVARVKYERTDRRNVVRVTLFDRRLDHGALVDYAESAGVESGVRGVERAPAARGRFRIHQGEPISILASHVDEGATGFYVTVICNDDALGTKPENRLWYWDNVVQQEYQVSPRCVLEESDAKESIHFSPPVKFSLSPTRGGFRILGDFVRGTYSMRIDANARSVDGGVLQAPYTATYSVPARRPQVAFVAQGRYLPKSAWTNLAVRHMNVGKVDLTIRHVPVENLVFWASGSSEAADERTSDVIAKRKLALSGPTDKLTTSFVDLTSVLPAPPAGLLELDLSAEGSTAKARLLVTDINLVAKQEGEKSGNILVWALSMHDNRAIPGVLVKAVVPSGRSVATCTTDRLGGCVLKTGEPEGAEKLDPAQPFSLIASREGDVTYLEFEDTKTQIADALVHGRPYSSTAPYRAGTFADRGVYRPGETAHVVSILRDEKDVAPPEGMPVDVELVDPSQKVTRKLVKKTNAAGVLSIDFKFDDFAPTGAYRVRLSAGKRDVGALGFNVEEFVPERMKASATLAKTDLAATEKAEVEVSARYLFGGSAEGSKVEVSCQLVPSEFAPKLNGNYSYGVWKPSEKPAQPITLGSVAGVLGANGTGRVTCPTARERGGFVGTSRLVAKAAVFEGGSGRTTQAEASAIVHPESFYVGLTSSTRKVKANDAFTVEGILVDWTGKPIEDGRTVDLELLRVEGESDWVYDEDEGTWSNRRYTHLASDGVLPPATTKGGKFSVSITAGTDASAFVVRARSGRAQTDLTLEGFGLWWWGDESDRDETPRPLRPAVVAIATPPSIVVGQKTKVAFESPFPGRALLSIETDRVLTHEWIEVAQGKMEWSFALPEFAPNVYVSAFVVKDPHQDSKESFLPSRAFGVTSVRVEPKAFDQAPKLEAPSEVRSESKLELELELGAADEPTFASVAAVDEGILSLTRFESPDPLALLFDRRALGVVSSETIGWNLLLPASGPSKSAGGDGGGSIGRVQPVKPVALWSGLLEVPKSGKLKVTFDVPQYRGSLRVMAVTAGKRRMGSAVASVIVRDPIVVQATLPRFLTLDDKVDVPVFVSNVSGRSADVEVSLSAEHLSVPGLVEDGGAPTPIEIDGEKSQKIALADGASQTVVFRVRALASVGAAKIRARAAAAGSTTEESLDVPFAPAAPRTRTVQRIPLSPGKNDVTKYLRGWLPTTEKSTLWVTGNPYGDAFDHLRYLLHYPYGCLEQTTSSARPLLYLANLVANVEPELVARDRIEAMIYSGINRILSMQTPQGGFAYWPGSEPVDWASAYATHFLLDAKKLGFAVTEERLKDALDWLEQELTTKYERDDSARALGADREHGEPYMQLVLALAGRGRRARVERLIETARAGARHDSEAKEALYMLQAALYLSGDRRYEGELKKPDVSAIQPERRNSWSFYSDRRRRGLTLALFSDLFGDDPAGDELTELVAESLRGHASGWYTTQELVWSITGLGKRVGASAKAFSPPTLVVDGKKLAGAAARPGASSSDRSWAVGRASERKELAIDLPDAEGQVFLLLGSEGVREDAKYQVGGRGLSIARSYRTPTGEPYALENGSLTLGSVVYSVIQLKNATGERIQNVALVDRFPAGFEIENPRLGRGVTPVSWIDPKDLWSVDSMDIRDDRLQAFGAIEPGQEKTFVYALRAVSAGQFTAPPVEAEAMYYPDHWAREPGGRVVIRGPWDAKK